jgi:hypothetical protein
MKTETQLKRTKEKMKKNRKWKITSFSWDT